MVGKEMVMQTLVPGQASIDLVRWYTQFDTYYPDAEMQVKQWIVNNVKNDWIIFDIGANIGYHSILFSRMANQGTVYAFEPIPATFAMLEENLKYNRIKNIIPVRHAIGLTVGKANESIWRIYGIEKEAGMYDFTTIDAFCKSKKIKCLDCIKIDTDGFDFEIVQGAIETLEKFNPWVIIEIYGPTLAERGYTLQDMTDWINYMGYKPISIDGSNFILHLEEGK